MNKWIKSEAEQQKQNLAEGKTKAKIDASMEAALAGWKGPGETRYLRPRGSGLPSTP